MNRRRPERFINILVFLIGFELLFAPSGFGRILFAQVISTGTQEFSNQPTPGTSNDPNIVSSAQSATETPLPVLSKRQLFLQSLKEQLQSAQNDYFSVNRNVKDTQTKLLDIQNQRLTLQQQLDSMDRQIQETLVVTQNVLKQVQEKENQILMMQNSIEVKNIEIENQKMMLSEYLMVMYQQENDMSDTTDKNSTINVAKMLLSDKTPDSALRELHYFTIFEDSGHRIIVRLETLLKEQQNSKAEIENTRNRLEMLYSQLEEQQATLQTQQTAKTQLLHETRGKEDIYQQLMDDSIAEQNRSLQDINSLRDNMKFIQNKMAELGDKFNPDDYKNILDGETTSVYEYLQENQSSDFHPRWPVSPSRGVSAYFHDDAYRRAMGVRHDAIDVRVPQSTPIHAPDDGVVYKTRDNGFGYSYIILAHSGGYLTVYGHVSEIRVKEGQKIRQGQVIGLSGAAPGTKGAGLMTTGAHLHFEVLKGGKHVDPLDYLPLMYLPLDSLPEKYLSRITGAGTKVSRIAGDDGVAGHENDVVQMVEQNGKLEQTSTFTQ